MTSRLLYKILFLVLLSPLGALGQTNSPEDQDLTGIWTGTLYNDSTKKSIPFEIAISEEKGVLSGYSHILFDINNKKEMGVKKIKIKRKDNGLVIDDVDLISNTYTEAPPKGIKFHGDVVLSVKDTLMTLSGTWSTNRTRQYQPNNGSIQLTHTSNYQPEPLFVELVRLKLDQQLSFVRAEKPVMPSIAIARPTLPQIATPNTPAAAPDMSRTVASSQASAAAVEPPRKVEPAPEPEIILTHLTANPVLIKNRPAAELFKASGDKRKNMVAFSAQKKEMYVAARDKRKEDYLVAYNKAQVAAATPPPVVTKPEPVVAIREPAKKTEPAVIQKPVAEKPKPTPPPVAATKPPAPVAQPPKPVVPPAGVVVVSNQQKQNPVAVSNAATDVAERKLKSEESVYFESDSLVLTLYDNGEVDGDTVSVLMNGQIIFARQGLSTNANTKTIYIDNRMDTVSMIMYAENLGSIPPNTGLLIIMDGDKRYEVRFSADLKTNAGILLKRRKKTG